MTYEINVSGLTKHQVRLLDKLWGFTSVDEMDEWEGTLSEEDQEEVTSLQYLLLCEMIDQDVVSEADCKQSRKLLKKFML